MKLKYTLLFFALTILFASCSNDDDTVVEDFDHVAQYEIEKDSLYGYLSTHYYNADTELIEDIDTESTTVQLALNLDSNLDSITHTLDDIDTEYTMYVYHTSEGGGEEYPDDNDIVWTAYTLMDLENEVIQDVPFYDEPDFDLSGNIVAWQLGLPQFKEGTVDEESDPTTPRSFDNPGEGFLIIPSGLAYQNFGSGSIPANETIVFRISLGHVEKVENEEEDEE